ncbi:CYTH and CHAD domain-containing protein [Mycolicibacterium sp. ND9-15]|uniref:CYTH and CHAD domain-containing protein n=1 Tax=Mycolicibacterium sp. ND9-15 TaxID=3042320 RepID=UPI002DD9791A|nr:CYTH and CHAD domain-containing protein [Mycolicibacterium sp. ND9-15]WSE55972.1 CYTH and CHAD domain-containing protein [Mycolicibacterium sp. ND9-15]
MGRSNDKSSRHLEVERKFDVDDSTVSPSFDGLSSVVRVERSPAQRLEAVYFDTPDHDLAARRITLRRRTGGPDEGWHLKLPAGPDARTEVREPLGEADEVPETLRDTVLAIARDRPLRPVARISTRRTVNVLYGSDGASLAEFCDDQVTASAEPGGPEQEWREWELELAPELAETADRDLLDRLSNRLIDAGAVPAASGSKLARVLAESSEPSVVRQPADPLHRAVAEQVELLIEWDRAVRADVWDSVHQMRVTTRKLRSLLQSSRDAFGISDDAWILDELRQLAAILGVARDAEVLAERYEQALDGLPDELVRGPVRERLVDGAKRRYQAGLRRSLIAMRSQRYFRLLDALEDLVAAEPAAPPGEEERGQATIDAAYKRVRKAAKAAAEAEADDHKDEALHRIRKGAKRLRYTAAATGAAKVSDRAKTIQSLLGDHQDSVVSRSHLGQQAEAAHAAGEDTFTYGLLYRLEEELAQRSREQLDDALAKLAKAVRKAR